MKEILTQIFAKSWFHILQRLNISFKSRITIGMERLGQTTKEESMIQGIL